MRKDGELTNFMVVASSDKNGNPVLNTNYGATALDIYAPGTDIYSSYMGDTYQKRNWRRNGFGYCSRCSCLSEIIFS